MKASFASAAGTGLQPKYTDGTGVSGWMQTSPPPRDPVSCLCGRIGVDESSSCNDPGLSLTLHLPLASVLPESVLLLEKSASLCIISISELLMNSLTMSKSPQSGLCRP